LEGEEVVGGTREPIIALFRFTELEDNNRCKKGHWETAANRVESGNKGRLTTHVLDLMSGTPARGLAIELWRLDGDAPENLKSVRTNDDGRVDTPLLAGEECAAGIYELRFMVGDYLKGKNGNLPEPLFLDVVPIRFGIADADSHYHVPLLLSAFGYSTYRGS
jgi:5-hydroxyisourate hydrolase